jgi:hypothetical protein
MNGDFLRDIVRKFRAVEGRFERHLLGIVDQFLEELERMRGAVADAVRRGEISRDIREDILATVDAIVAKVEGTDSIVGKVGEIKRLIEELKDYIEERYGD